jgi:WD40 repeat protein
MVKKGSAAPAEAKDYIKTVVGVGNQVIPGTCNVGDILKGATQQRVLEDAGVVAKASVPVTPPVSGSGGPPPTTGPTPNLAPTGAGNNTLAVDSVTQTCTIYGRRPIAVLRLRAKESPPLTDPTTAAPTVKVIADLTGSYGNRLAFDPGGKRWALADNRTIQLGSDGTLDRRPTAAEPIHHLVWSPDGKRLLAGPLIYDLPHDAWEKLPGLGKALTSGLAEPPPADQLGIGAAAYAPDGKDLVLAVYFQPSRGVDAADSYSGPQERVLAVGPDRALRGALYAGDNEMRALAVGDRLIAAGGSTVQVWERQSLRKVADLKHKLVARALAFNAEGDRLGVITADGAVSIWDPAAGTLVASFPAHQGDGYAIAFHPKQPLVATGGQDGKLQLWTLTGTAVHTETLGGWVQAVAFDAAGTRLGAVARATPPHLTIYSVAMP